jgi:pyruvate,water dikinase
LGERDRFDDLAAVAGDGYGHNDDNTVVLFSLPLGLVRRAALEIGRRAGLAEPNDAMECSAAELVALAAVSSAPSKARGLLALPTTDELARRADERRTAASVEPPPVLGEPLPPEPEPDWGPSTRTLMDLTDAFSRVAWSRPSGGGPGATVGTQSVRGRALVVADPVEALDRLEPGDILVAVTTTAVFNTIFPLVAGVAVEHGGFMGHAAILARELGLPAVIGVPGLLARVKDGQTIELDPVAGTVTVVS